MTVTPAHVKRVTSWYSHSKSQSQLQVAHIQLKDVTIQLNQAKLPSFAAEIQLNSLGRVETATLTLAEQDAYATLTSQGDQYGVSVQAKRLTLPIGAPVLIQSFKANGVTNTDSLTIERMQGYLYGGNLEGSATFDWSNHWNVSAKLNIQEASLDGLTPNFSNIQAKGNLATNIDLTADAREIERLFDKPTLKARFTIDQGEIGWIDIIRAIQVAKKNMAINGPTSFDQLSGQLSMKNGQYTYEQLVLKSGNLRATGAFNIQGNQQLKGSIRVNLNTPTRKVKSTLQLTGSTAHPQTK
jgi:hypothetical protein